MSDLRFILNKEDLLNEAKECFDRANEYHLMGHEVVQITNRPTRFPCLVFLYTRTILYALDGAVNIVTMGCINFPSFELRMAAYPKVSFTKRSTGLNLGMTYFGLFNTCYMNAIAQIHSRFDYYGVSEEMRVARTLITRPSDFNELHANNPKCVVRIRIELDRLNPRLPVLGYIGRIAAVTADDARMLLMGIRDNKRQEAGKRKKERERKRQERMAKKFENMLLSTWSKKKNLYGW